MSVKLVMFNRQGQRRAFGLSQAETVIGRALDCALRVPLAEVSRRHCLVSIRADGVRVKDLGSTNGTYVNGKRINEAILEPGDRMTIGPVVLTLQVNGTPAESVGVEAGPTPDAEDTVLADIEAAIALGPDELEDSRADLEAIIPPDQDPLTALESLELETGQGEDQPQSQDNS